MADYEIHRVIVQVDDDLADILNNIGDNTELILRDGRHTLDAQANLSGLSNVTLWGTKAAIIEVTYTSGTNAPILITAPAADITFEGFCVEYAGSAGTTTPLFGFAGTGGADIFRVAVKDIHADFQSGAVTFVRQDGQDIDIYGITVAGCRIYGSNAKGLFRMAIAANRELKHVQLLDNEVTRDSQGGSQTFALYTGSSSVIEDILVQGNTWENIQEHLYVVATTSSTCRKFVIDGNTFTGGDSDGCRFEGVYIEKVKITDNTFTTTGGGACLTLLDGSYYNVSDNDFLDAVGDGLFVGEDVTDSTIDNNTATGCGDAGIDVAGDNNRISNNTCEGNDIGIQEDASADSNHYVGNTCRNNTTLNRDLSGTNRRQGVNSWAN